MTPHKWSRERFRMKMLQHIPVPVLEHSFELFVSGLGITGSIPLIRGRFVPNSIEASMPAAVVRVWAITVVIGCLFTFAGVVAKRRTLESPGLTLLSASTAAYALILCFASPSGAVNSVLYWGFAITCLLRVFVLHTAVDVIRRLRKSGDWIDG